MSKIFALALAATVLVFSLGSFGCGGGDSGGLGASGLDKGKKLTKLTDDEKKQLCDWKAQKYGGYGQNITCTYRDDPEPVTILGEMSQDICVAELPWPDESCAVTVGGVEDCTNSISCSNRVPSPCKPVLACEFGSEARLSPEP
jgi:hypothetical protein